MIDVNLIDEQGEALEQVIDSKSIVELLASDWAERLDSVCLRFVDPYGDAVFNRAQIPILLAELKESESEQSDQKIKAHLRDVIDLVERAQGQVHVYIEFSGD